jgi:hypothetical protein
VAESVPELEGDVGHGCGLRWRPLESVPTQFDLLARLPSGSLISATVVCGNSRAGSWPLVRTISQPPSGSSPKSSGSGSRALELFFSSDRIPVLRACPNTPDRRGVHP